MLIPLGALGAALLYALGYLELKGSIHHGATSKRVNIFSNYAMAAWSMPLALLPLLFPKQFGFHPDLASALAAVGAGLSLFIGRICTVKALAKADLSISAPLLGTKTILVALFSILLLHTPVGWKLLTAAALTVIALTLLQTGPDHNRHHRRAAVGWAMGASILFALVDVLTQGYARKSGVAFFQPMMFVVLAAMTPALGSTPPAPPLARKRLLIGGAVIGFQAPLVIMLIGLFGEATLINILYATRTIWSVAIDAWKGEGNAREYWPARLGGSLLLLGAIILALLK
jgi:drug/metabolite transporter (DMT)-like permease